MNYSGATSVGGGSKSRKSDSGGGNQEEYAGDDADEQNWKGIIIALLVIVAICGLVVLAVVLVTPVHTEEELGEPFTFDDLYNPEFKVQKFNAKWIRGRNAYVYRSKPDGDLRLYDVETNETTLIMRNLIFENQNTDFYLVSEDASYVLLAFDIEPVHRYSFLAKYVIYDPRSISESNSHLVAFPLSLEGEWTNKKLQYAGWSPSGHSLTFVWGNNLYFQSNPFTTPARVTDNKREPFIFNGLPDWLYEEEIFRSNVAHWLSDDCRHVAYVQFNDTNVPVARLAVFGDSNEIYERVKEVSYPKAGDLNPDKYPVAKLFIAETANAKGSHRLIQPPSAILKNNDYYITLVRWKDNAHLLVVWTNRAQNQTIITSCNVVSTDCHVNLVDTQNRGWTTIDNVMFTTTSQQFVTILPQQINENGSWKHIASISTRMDSDGTKTFLTHGRWDVMNIVGYNEINSTIYFVSTNGDPRHRHLFKLILSNDGRHVTNQPVCMTCSSSSDQCHFVSTQFSSTGRYYIQGCLGPSVPRYTLKSTADDDTIMVVEDNAVLKSRLRNKALPRKEYFNVTTDDGETLWGQMYLPRILNKDHITQYPLLVNIHETLGSQQVTEEFRLDWPTFMSSSENVICASVDGRGTSARGLHFLHAIFHRLGSIEVKDQIKAINFIKQYQYVDKEKISVWGSLYGGFIVSHLIADSDEHGAEVQCAAAVTPVTDWRYYNAAYSEKHMGTTVSTGNYRGYDNANVSSKAVRFKEKGFLLVHAMADENVHFQHSAQLMKALTEVGVNFQSQIYADLTHDQLITGSKTSRHLYRTLGRFLKHDCWFSAKSLEAKLLHVASETNKKQNMKS